MLNPCSASSSVGAWDSRHSRCCLHTASRCVLLPACPVRMPWSSWRACQAAPQVGHPQLPGVKSRRCVLMHNNSLAVSNSSTQASSMPAVVSKADHVYYRFVVPEYVTHFGEYLKVVGSLPELGSWDLAAAPAMTWQPGHKWLLEVKLPRSTYEFKVVALQGNGVRWEQGINRVVQAENGSMEVPVELVINVHCAFGLTAQTGMELVLDRKSVQESYELASATLELLQQRRTKLQKQLQKAPKNRAPTPEQEEEAARLDAALSQQQRSLADLGALVSTARLSDDGEALLLQLDGAKVQVPDPVSFLASAHTASVSLALQAAEPAQQVETSSQASTNGNGSSAGSNGNGTAYQQTRAAAVQDTQQRVASGAKESKDARRLANDTKGVAKGVKVVKDTKDAGGPAAAGASLSQVVGQVQDEWGTEGMGSPAVEAYLQGDSSALESLESDHDLEPDDAAAAMAAAAFAVLPNSSHSKRTHKRGSDKAEQDAEDAQPQDEAGAEATAKVEAKPASGLWPGLGQQQAEEGEEAAAKEEQKSEPVSAAAPAAAAASSPVVPGGPGSDLAAFTAASADDDMVAAVAAAVATEEAAAASAALNGASSLNFPHQEPPFSTAFSPAVETIPAPAPEPGPVPTPKPTPALLEVVTAAAVTAAIAEQRKEVVDAVLAEPTAPTGEPVAAKVQAVASMPVTSKVEAAVAAAAAANEEVAAELVAAQEAAEHGGSLSKLLADVDISSLPAPKAVAGGALFFSSEVLSSFNLVKKPKPQKPRVTSTKQRRRIEAVP